MPDHATDESADAAVASPPQRRTNVGSSERVASLAAGAVLAALGLGRRGVPRLVATGLGAALIQRGATGRCAAYGALGLDTASPPRGADAEVAARGIHLEHAFVIARPADDLYEAWRDLASLPCFMAHLQSVEVLDERRSRWTARAPAIAGGSVSWEAEITREEPGAVLAWRSLPGSAVATVGEVRFAPAPGDRGTEVRVAMEYVPPAGRVGHALAALVGDGAHRQLREDLRAFKRLMETGEIPTTAGQPRGTCLGHGHRARRRATGATS